MLLKAGNFCALDVAPKRNQSAQKNWLEEFTWNISFWPADPRLQICGEQARRLIWNQQRQHTKTSVECTCWRDRPFGSRACNQITFLRKKFEVKMAAKRAWQSGLLLGVWPLLHSSLSFSWLLDSWRRGSRRARPLLLLLATIWHMQTTIRGRG